MKKTILKILAQILPVMLGVYLGFALNNYGERRSMRKKVDTYQHMLQNEIKDNLKQVKRVLPYHDTLALRVQDLLNSEDIKKEFENFRFTGLRPGMVHKSAFDTGIQTGVLQEFDLDLIQRLNRLYAFQDSYEKYNLTMMSTFLSKDFPEEKKQIKSLFTALSMNMHDVINFENQLAASYEKVLEQLKD